MDMSLSNLQEIVKEREAWDAAVHGVIKSWAQFSDWTKHQFFVPSFWNVVCVLSRSVVSDSLQLHGL